MKLKLISNGEAWGTKVVNTETGETLDYVQSVEWRADVNELNGMGTAIIKLFGVKAEIEIDDPAIEVLPPQ
jgi:hypothetical protein